MNRRFLFCFSLIMFAHMGWSQTDSVWRLSLRDEALKSYALQSRQLKSYYEAVDIAFRSSSKENKRTLDSLMTDSIFVSAGLQLPLYADRLLDQRRLGNQAGSTASLLSIARALDSLNNYNAFERILLRFATGIAQETKNERASLLLSTAHLKVVTADHQVSSDSLKAAIETLEKSIADVTASNVSAEHRMSEEIRLWQVLTGVAVAAFLILLVVFLIVRHSIIQKLRFELSKNMDTSELQVLVRKNEDLKNECEQYKQTLEEVIRKMNSLDLTLRNYSAILEELKGMSMDAMELLRQHLEENKSKLSPEVYMGLTNVISRSSASLRDEYNRTIEQLI